MNSLVLKISNQQQKLYKNVRMLVFDMAGTTVNEKGIVYDTLYDTIKSFGLNISRKEIHDWHGANKYEVLDYYLKKDGSLNNETFQRVQSELHTKFNGNLNV